MRFSKPCCARFEKGRLSGSAQTRSCAVTSIPKSNSTTKLRKRKHIERASFSRDLLQFLGGVREAESCGRVARIKATRHDDSGPSTYAGENRDVLLTVGTTICDGLSDDPGPGLKFPKLFSAYGVNGFEPAIHRAVEDDVSGGCERPAPHRKLFLQYPDRFRVDGIPGGEFAEVSTR